MLTADFVCLFCFQVYLIFNLIYIHLLYKRIKHVLSRNLTSLYIFVVSAINHQRTKFLQKINNNRPLLRMINKYGCVNIDHT